MLAIVTAATKGYLHAWPQCLRAITATAAHHEEAHFIFVTDESEAGSAAAELAKRELPEGWKVTVLKHPIASDGKDYKAAAQCRIARLQGSGFAFARKIRASVCLSVESDTILPAHALRVLEWTLQMPRADGRPLYGVAAATYPNGLFLGGFGTPSHPIAEDFLPKERNLSARLRLCLETCEARLKAPATRQTGEKEFRRLGRLRDRIRSKSPTGSIWEVIAEHGWRRRGWLDFAYPGVGEGAVVPSDWCGLGATLLSKEALAHADFTGYDGRGTQDLYLCWRRWYPAGIRIACVPHVACDHIKPKASSDPGTVEIVHHHAWHETEGEFRGHLRQTARPFVPV